MQAKQSVRYETTTFWSRVVCSITYSYAAAIPQWDTSAGQQNALVFKLSIIEV